MTSLTSKVAQVIRAHYPHYWGEVVLETKSDRTDCDYATPVAFGLAKEEKVAPQDIAAVVVPLLQEALGDSAEVFMAPQAPPFINIKLHPTGWGEALTELATDQKRGVTPTHRGKQVLVEFLSANPTGPATLANGRGGYCGDALANVYAFAGAEVEREYYVNDTGNQIVQLGKSIIAARQGETIEDGYKGTYIQDLAHQIVTDDPTQAGKQAAEHILESWIKPATKRMGIHFDRFFSEEKLAESGAVQTMLDLLAKHELTYEHDGALWLRTTKYGDDKDRVVRKSDGLVTYVLTDLAYHWDKIQRGYDVLVTLMGADHFTESQTLQLLLEQFLIPMHKCAVAFHNPLYQFVRLMKDGEEIKMSKRAGNFVTLDDLLDEVDSDVARFFFVSNAYSNRMDFDLNVAKATSDQNPVYYVQYAYVRAKHILEKEAAPEINLTELSPNSEERLLLLHLLEFPHIINQVLATQEVHYLAHYAIELARRFHVFYTHHQVIKAEPGVKEQRLALTRATMDVLKQTLGLIGVSQPEHMVAEVKA